VSRLQSIIENLLVIPVIGPLPTLAELEKLWLVYAKIYALARPIDGSHACLRLRCTEGEHLDRVWGLYL
jgi:hypothetical protein